MAVRIGHASIDENGKIKGGRAGDQNEREVCIRPWYLHKKGWVVLRCRDGEKREKIAEAMEKACANPLIGYNQNRRDSLFSEVKDRGFDPSRTERAVDTDCSALVRVCIAYAFGEDIVGNIRTVREPDVLEKTGCFEKLTGEAYCTSCDWLLRGDILCTPVSGHTAVVLDDGSKTGKTYTVEISVLFKGCKGDAVRAMQTLLIGYGFDCGAEGVDGSFGGATDRALRAFQLSRGLETDGRCGPQTWGKLLGNG